VVSALGTKMEIQHLRLKGPSDFIMTVYISYDPINQNIRELGSKIEDAKDHYCSMSTDRKD
jgi:hypothetical protein